MELEGQIVRKPFGTGTKSEHDAIYVESAAGRFVLRRPGTNPFEIDRDLEALVGARVRFSGSVSGYTFFVSKWEVLGEGHS
jgi:hypothetical protein